MLKKCLDGACRQPLGTIVGFIFNHPGDNGLAGENCEHLLKRSSQGLHGLDGGDEKLFSVKGFLVDIWMKDEFHSRRSSVATCWTRQPTDVLLINY